MHNSKMCPMANIHIYIYIFVDILIVYITRGYSENF